MKVLLDACVWGGARHELTSLGHDVVWVGEWTSDPGDDEVLSRSFEDGRVLITLDKDFGELAVVHGRAHCGIVRLVDLAALQQARVSHQAISRFGSELRGGAIVTANSKRFRIRLAS